MTFVENADGSLVDLDRRCRCGHSLAVHRYAPPGEDRCIEVGITCGCESFDDGRRL